MTAQTVAVVTGASRGLGYHVAKRLGAAGVQVVAVARTVGGLEELDDDIKAAGGPGAVLTPLDVTDGDGIDRFGAALFERFGRVDRLVHAAARAAPLSTLRSLKPKDMAALFEVNAVATARIIRSMHPLLELAPDGRALFVVDRKAGRPLWGGYGASKAAAEALAQSYAAEKLGVDVRLFEPPPMATALRGRTHPGETPEMLARPADIAADLVAALEA